jgi:uncharacterized protein (DUF3820 family)
VEKMSKPTAFQKQLIDERTGNRPKHQKLRTMPFGKHKGKPINKIPREYLWWMSQGEFAENNPDLAGLAKIALAMPKAPLKHKKKQCQHQAKVSNGETQQPTKARKRSLILTLKAPYAARHPVPADVIIDPSEACPF